MWMEMFPVAVTERTFHESHVRPLLIWFKAKEKTHGSSCEMWMSQTTETTLTFCLYEVTQCLKVKEKLGHIFTAKILVGPHKQSSDELVLADRGDSDDTAVDAAVKHQHFWILTFFNNEKLSHSQHNRSNTLLRLLESDSSRTSEQQ